MSDTPLRTLEFPEVVSLETPLPYFRSARSEPLRSPAGPSTIPEGYEYDAPTGRTTLVPLNAIVSSADRPLLKVLLGLNAGQVFNLERDETFIGRGRQADVRIDEAGISRRHARVLRIDGRQYIVEDLASANGIFVNGRKVDRVDLVDGDRLQVGPHVVLRFCLTAADEEALARKLYDGSTRDGLTRLYNRQHASERLVAEVAYAHRHATQFSFVLFDLDHFKRVNDEHGHAAGDLVLRVVAAQVQKAVRVEDVLARYGGEEFVVLVRGLAHESVKAMAERIRRGVERLSIPCVAQTLRATVSVGVASLSECGAKATAEALVALADERLYLAKAGGRNQVC